MVEMTRSAEKIPAQRCNAGGLALSLLLTLTTPGVAAAQATQVRKGIVLNHVAIVDTLDGTVHRDMSMALDQGRITQIERAGGIRASGSAREIQASGDYVVPGYWEMHAHPLDSPDRDVTLALMLANGITGVRQMSGSDALLEQRRAGELMPLRDSPELLAMPGAILLHKNAGTIQQALAEVDKQKIEGADFIKTINVSPAVFFAALTEASKQGLPYDGHLSPGVDAHEASKAGMKAIEHLGSPELMLVSCSTDEAAIRATTTQRLRDARLSAPADSGKAGTSNPTLSRVLADPSALQAIRHVIDTYSDEKCHELAERFRENTTWQVPTLIRMRTSAYGDDVLYQRDPNLKYAAPAVRLLWADLAAQFSGHVDASGRATLQQLYALQLKLAKILDDAGVPMLAGSDFGGIWLIAGFSLHQEFDQLAEAGFTPLKVLQMSTLDAARFLGRDATDGTVRVGSHANLVLLKRNPMESVANLHSITGVVRAGRYYPKSALDQLKRRAEIDLHERTTESPAR